LFRDVRTTADCGKSRCFFLTTARRQLLFPETLDDTQSIHAVVAENTNLPADGAIAGLESLLPHLADVYRNCSPDGKKHCEIFHKLGFVNASDKGRCFEAGARRHNPSVLPGLLGRNSPSNTSVNERDTI